MNDMCSDFATENQLRDFLELSSRYQSFSEEIHQDFLGDLKVLVNSFEQDAVNAQNESRLLRVGIVGQIKRGKSSFLNSLLFEGRDLLPKAATPMTAALTRISYAEKPSAKIEFYSKNEWQNIKASAESIARKEAKYQEELSAYQAARRNRVSRDFLPPTPQSPRVSDEDKASLELFQMVESSGLQVDDYLGQVAMLEGIESTDQLVSKLNDYVGADGHYTPIVKSTELQLDIESLKDIEVVDTPGMNDPIISRSRRTQEFIGQCDVVFFLSYCGQFLDQHDMALLAQNIPNKGIEEIVLIGSLFDSALLDEYHEYESIQDALPALTRKLNQEASSNVEQVCALDKEQSGQSHLMTTLQNALPPLFLSARCHDLSLKGPHLSEEEQHSLNQLNRMYEGFEFGPDALRAIGNFGPVEARLASIRNKKEQILSERFNNLLTGSQRGVLQILERMRADIADKRKLLSEGDLDSLTEQQQAIIKRIEAGQEKVGAVFEKYRILAEKEMGQTRNSIQQSAVQAKQVRSETGSREESYTTSREVYDPGWDPRTWFSTRTVTEHHTRTVNYTYANVQESVAMLEQFVVEVQQQLFDAASQAIPVEAFRQDIKSAVKGMFDFSDESFDPERVLLPLSNAVDRITIPAIHLNLDHHIKSVREQFVSPEVEGDEVQQLRNEQARVVAILLGDIAKELDSNIQAIAEKLTQQEQVFIPSLTRDLTDTVERLKHELKNKEATLERYGQIYDLLVADIAELKAL
ncbi:dynamin family protein [Marinobacter sp. ANT_B65]|uniref:dynamin family protein n=1 Tax=Marinobacter sp. ANT_B65 TaxID=2039467 RepID=UPI000BBE93F8|nr:dynamin family protein [Marinobacter sp. ANT_B65]PCM45928.1 hypothetical protein CPA50_08210 [Marinobacter sp. ANT_B65]